MLTPADVGHRVVVRRALPDGRATDLLGELVELGRGVVRVRRADGSVVGVADRDVVLARRVPPGPARLRPARPEDAAGIEELRQLAWRTAYRQLIPGSFLDAMAVDVERRRELLTRMTPDLTTLVADSAGAVVGWAVAGPSRDADLDPASTGEVYACYVAPTWWRHGVGSRLLRRLLSGLLATGRADVRLWVLAGNEAARQFYARHGFAPDGASQVLHLGGPVTEVRCRRTLR